MQRSFAPPVFPESCIQAVHGMGDQGENIHAGISMDSNSIVVQTEQRRRALSILWVFVMFNMVFADIVGLLNPGTLEDMIAMKPPQSLLLVFSVLLEIPIAMIVLSQMLPRKVNRVANIIAAVITILWVIGGGTMSASYIFFAAMEVGCMLFIIRYAWMWTEPVVKADPLLVV